jgi:hypothetical protein
MRCATKVMQEVVYVLVPYKVSYARKSGMCPFLEMAAPLKSHLFLKAELFEACLLLFLMSCAPNKAMKK